MMLAFALFTLTAASGPGIYNLDTAKSVLRYHIVHKVHKVDGETNKVEGKANVLANGQTQLMLRAQVATFSSGNQNRDEHMQETMETARYPSVVLKAVTPLTVPLKTGDYAVTAQIDLHGQKNDEKIPVHINAENPKDIHVTGSFTISLDKYKIERPSLLLVKIEDSCVIDVDVHFTPQ